MVMSGLCRSKSWIVAAVALVSVAGCGADGGAGNGSGDAGSDRATVIGSWQDEFCPTVQPDLVAERMSYTEYVHGPVYLPMGHATTPNTFDCLAMVDIHPPELDDPVKSEVKISIYNGKEPTRSGVEEYYQESLRDWLAYYDELEVDSSEYEQRERDGVLQPFLDEKLDGSWVAGQAYAIKGAGTAHGSVFVAVRNEDYALFVSITIPTDPEVSQARDAADFYERRGEEPPAGLDEQGIESRRVLPFTDEEIAEWTTTEYITTVYDAVEAKLGEQQGEG